MTEQAKEKQAKKNIPNPLNQALMAGGATSFASVAGSLLFDVPVDDMLKMASGVFCSGFAFSLYLSWQDSRYRTAPRRRKTSRQVNINSYSGSRKIDLEYSLETGAVLTREGYFEALKRQIFGSSNYLVQPTPPVNKPKVLDEFIFQSHYNGYLVQLRSKHVKLFLNNAWRNRFKNGKSLSERHWVKRRSQRPMWYKELSPIWYYGMRNLIIDTWKALKIQMTVETGNNWYSMAHEPREFYSLLKWFECERRKMG